MRNRQFYLRFRIRFVVAEVDERSLIAVVQPQPFLYVKDADAGITAGCFLRHVDKAVHLLRRHAFAVVFHFQIKKIFLHIGTDSYITERLLGGRTVDNAVFHERLQNKARHKAGQSVFVNRL